MIQKASYRSDLNDPIGYHDEAFEKITAELEIDDDDDDEQEDKGSRPIVSFN